MSAAQSHDEFSSSISKPHISRYICLPNRWRTSHQQHQTNPNHTISSFLLPTVSLLCCLCVQPVCWGCVIAVVCSNAAMLSAPPSSHTHPILSLKKYEPVFAETCCKQPHSRTHLRSLSFFLSFQRFWLLSCLNSGRYRRFQTYCKLLHRFPLILLPFPSPSFQSKLKHELQDPPPLIACRCDV